MEKTSYDYGKHDGQVIQELKDINSNLSDLKELVRGQEARLRILENWRWYLIGSSAVIGIGAAKLTQAMMNL